MIYMIYSYIYTYIYVYIYIYIYIYTCLYEQIYYQYINLTTKDLKLCYISTFTKSVKDL